VQLLLYYSISGLFVNTLYHASALISSFISFLLQCKMKGSRCTASHECC